MTKYLKHLLAGMITGIVFFLGPGLISKSGGLLGWDSLSRFVPVMRDSLFITALIYLFFSIPIFFVYFYIFNIKGKVWNNLVAFLTGVFIAYLVFVYFGGLALSHFQIL